MPLSRRSRALLLGTAAAAAVAAGLLGRHLFASRRTPAGQPPLTFLAGAGSGGLREAFNAAASETRILVLLSPT
jgi:hypothetical protein